MRIHFSKVWPSIYVCGGILLLSFLLPMPNNGKILNVGSICSFQNFFGLPCPGCGLTRSFVAMGHGLFQESYRWHPLGPFLFGLTVIYLIASLFLLNKQPPLKIDWRVQVGSLLVLAFVMLVFWGLRLNGVFPMPLK
jgi:hypothetical protein